MKNKTDLVRGWLRKGKSDLASVNMCLEKNQSLDIACFHAQQAAEKFLKAYLIEKEAEFPFIHNLEKLIELCASIEPAFQALRPLGAL